MNLDYRALADHWMRRVDEVGLLAAIDEIAAPALVAESGMGARDLEGLRARFEEMAVAFPDATVTLEDVLVDGPKVCLILDWQGTFLGPLRGFRPTGQPVKFAIVMIMHMSGFMVDRVRIYSEAFTGPVQMGLIPAFDDLNRTEGPI
jgi:predicted ester cyclase